MEFLLIDNDKTSREVVSFLLEEEGHASECMAWTEHMWERLREKTFDAVLIDLDSNPAAGWDVFREIQRMQPNLPLVLLVVENRLNLTLKAMDRGILEILEKPFGREHLILVIARLRRNSAMRRRIERLKGSVAKGSKPAAQRVVIALLPANAGASADGQAGKRPGPAQVPRQTAASRPRDSLRATDQPQMTPR
jgi:DNA-binding NtrC family response regulator